MFNVRGISSTKYTDSTFLILVPYSKLRFFKMKNRSNKMTL